MDSESTGSPLNNQFRIRHQGTELDLEVRSDSPDVSINGDSPRAQRPRMDRHQLPLLPRNRLSFGDRDTGASIHDGLRFVVGKLELEDSASSRDAGRITGRPFRLVPPAANGDMVVGVARAWVPGLDPGLRRGGRRFWPLRRLSAIRTSHSPATQTNG